MPRLDLKGLTMERKEIRHLPSNLVSQIAAGEVIERPSSCVKEMMENSLDAGASRIDVSIEDGGVKLICIDDDGCGIPPEELPLAFARHATSKIRAFDDLFKVSSMGFRGEAVASVASVARVEISSAVKGAKSGWTLSCSDGELGTVFPCARKDGTRVMVKDLFFFVPARRKFLKSSATESSKCVEAFCRVAFSRPDVSFSFKKEGRTLFSLQAGTLLERAVGIFGEKFSESSAFEAQSDGISVKGLLAPASFVSASKERQYLFVNGRHVRDKLILSALKNAALSVVGQGGEKNFSFVAFIELPPEEVDVNAHPAKSEVRFRKAQAVHQIVAKAFSSAMGRFSQIVREQETSQVDIFDKSQSASPQSPSLFSDPFGEANSVSSRGFFHGESFLGNLLFSSSKGLFVCSSREAIGYVRAKKNFPVSNKEPIVSAELFVPFQMSETLDIRIRSRLMGCGVHFDGNRIVGFPTAIPLADPVEAINALSGTEDASPLCDFARLSISQLIEEPTDEERRHAGVWIAEVEREFHNLFFMKHVSDA